MPLLALVPRRLCRPHSLKRLCSTLQVTHPRCRSQQTSRFPRQRQSNTVYTAFLSQTRFLSALPEKEKHRKSNELEGSNQENIYTIPNALTLSRILACPFLAWSIVQGDFSSAACILAYAGISDWVDGFLARRYRMRSVLGTILDPAADKVLMTTLTITLAMKDLVPVPLACIILGRDVLLSVSALYIRYKTLPTPKTLQRYWDFSIPSAEVHPTGISKFNTVLQLLLMGVTVLSPLTTLEMGLILHSLQWTVAGTTILSGLSYAFSTSAVRVITSKPHKKRP